MANENFLLMQKTGATNATSTSTWGIYLTEMPMLVSTERKEAEANDWLDEDGDDLYLGSRIYLKAFDAEIKLAKKGTMTQVQTAFASLLNYLTTEGTKLKVYSDWVKMGRKGVSFVKCTVPNYEPTGDDECPFVAQWTLTLHVSDPKAEVCCAANGADWTLTDK